MTAAATTGLQIHISYQVFILQRGWQEVFKLPVQFVKTWNIAGTVMKKSELAFTILPVPLQLNFDTCVHMMWLYWHGCVETKSPPCLRKLTAHVAQTCASFSYIPVLHVSGQIIIRMPQVCVTLNQTSRHQVKWKGCFKESIQNWQL